MPLKKSNSNTLFICSLLIAATLIMSIEGQICGPECNSCTTLTQCTNCQIGSFCCDPNCYQCISGPIPTVGLVNCNTCQPGFTLNSTTNQCFTQTCVANSLTCLTCNGNICTACITGEYVDQNANVCYPCGVANCASCSSYGACTQCSPGFYKIAATNVNTPNSCGTCSVTLPKCTACNDGNTCTACENGFFLNSSTSVCQACIAPCTGCIQNFCTNCPDGYYITGASCSLCALPCKTCGGTANSCTSCTGDLILNGDVCQNCSSYLPQCLVCNQTTTPISCSTCQTGFYPNSTNQGECSACSITCQACNSSTVCTQCYSTYVLNSNGTCVSCSDHCAACRIIPNNPSFNTSCVSCNNGSIIVSVSQNSSILICQLCTTYSIPNCEICSADKSCSKCYDTYNLVGQQCISFFDFGTPWWAIMIVVLGILLIFMLSGIFVYYLFFMKKPYPQSLLTTSERALE